MATTITGTFAASREIVFIGDAINAGEMTAPKITFTNSSENDENGLVTADTIQFLENSVNNGEAIGFMFYSPPLVGTLVTMKFSFDGDGDGQNDEYPESDTHRSVQAKKTDNPRLTKSLWGPVQVCPTIDGAVKCADDIDSYRDIANFNFTLPSEGESVDASTAKMYYHVSRFAEWTWLRAWTLDPDENVRTPAPSLPGPTTAVDITGSLLSNAGPTPEVASMELNPIGASAVLDITIKVNGVATFNDYMELHGTIIGNAQFNGSSRIFGDGRVEGGATFYNKASMVGGTVVGSASFFGESVFGGAVEGSVVFEENSRMASGATVTAREGQNDVATFTGNSKCYGEITSFAKFEGESVLYGTVVGDAEFHDFAYIAESGRVTGDVTFKYSPDWYAEHTFGRGGNLGTIEGTATFETGTRSCNGATGTATVFVPNPPPACPS